MNPGLLASIALGAEPGPDAAVNLEVEVARSPLPHDARLEPLDETVAEVQAFVAASRQAGDLGAPELVAGASHALARLIATSNPAWAVALAGFALRLREEHLV